MKTPSYRQVLTLSKSSPSPVTTEGIFWGLLLELENNTSLVFSALSTFRSDKVWRLKHFGSDDTPRQLISIQVETHLSHHDQTDLYKRRGPSTEP